jgi:hypothetical protein
MPKSNDQRGEALRDGRVPQLPGVGVIDPRDPEGRAEGDLLDLSSLLKRLLLTAEKDGSKSWAQLVLEGWIVAGLEGDCKVVDGIFERCQASRPAAAAAADERPLILDERTAGTILEALCASRHGEASG